MAVYEVRTFLFFFGSSNNFFFGLSTNICIEILFLFLFYNFQSPFQRSQLTSFCPLKIKVKSALTPPECYFKHYKVQRKMPHQNGFSRIPVPSGEKGFTLAHIKASFSEIADFPSSRKNTGPCTAKVFGEGKKKVHMCCVKATTTDNTVCFISGGHENLIYN